MGDFQSPESLLYSLLRCCGRVAGDLKSLLQFAKYKRLIFIDIIHCV